MSNLQHKCRMCGQPEAAHRIVFWDGVAHTTAIGADGHTVLCSQRYAERDYYQGRVNALMTVVRSLRTRAGRLRNRGQHWTPDDLNTYSDYLARDVERAMRLASGQRE